MSWFTDGIISILVWLNNLTGSLGLAIIIFTILFRGILLIFTYKSLISMKKIQGLSGEVADLRQKYKDDPKALQLAQMELYKKHNVNPLSGCLPQLLQLVMLIFIYQALIGLIGTEGIANTQFLWLDLTTPDPLYIIPILAALSQLFLSIMTLPGGEKRDLVPNNSKKKSIQELNKKENNSAQMAATMQKQMLFLLPIMTGFIALSLPSGLGLYWIVSTLFSIVQQVKISGWGGIVIYASSLKRFFTKQA